MEAAGEHGEFSREPETEPREQSQKHIPGFWILLGVVPASPLGEAPLGQALVRTSSAVGGGFWDLSEKGQKLCWRVSEQM